MNTATPPTVPMRCTTALFAPGTSLRKMEKALLGDADVVVLDLEDSVPIAEKPQARATLNEAVANADRRPEQIRIVRVNHEGGWEGDDLEVVRTHFDAGSIQGVMIPKTSSSEELDSFIAAVGRRIPIWAVATETPVGVTNLVSICRHPDLVAVCWGPEDLSVLMGSFGARDDTGAMRPVYEWVRWQVLVAARAAGVEALDTVFVDLNDSDRLALEARNAAEAGFSGKMAIHPAQLPIIEASFRTPERLIDWSERLLAERDRSGLGAFAFDGSMVDQPHFKLATRILHHEGRGTPAMPAQGDQS